jgi:hypothetical protein
LGQRVRAQVLSLRSLLLSGLIKMNAVEAAFVDCLDGHFADDFRKYQITMILD